MSALVPSRKAQGITHSITLAISARAKAMQAEGVDVISLGAGEPDFHTPDNVAEAGIAAIREGHTRYTASSGISELRAAAARWFERRFGLAYGSDEVMVTAGAKPALTMALMALVDEGDPVLVPAPYWPSYDAIIRLAQGVPIELAAVPEQGFVHDGAQIADAARENGARGMVINFPNNPSGAVPSRAQVESIVDAALECDLWIVSDEIYARLIYDGLRHVSPANFERARDRVVVINGGTKSHSMTGWRLGFCAGPKDIVAAAGRIQSQAIGNPCTISQHAALEVCNETDDAALASRLAAFDERRRYLVDAINAIDGLALEKPAGAFYALVDVRAVCERRGIDDVAFTEQLLTEALVAGVPGTPFGAPGFLRLSYAAAMEDLERAVARVEKFVAG